MFVGEAPGADEDRSGPAVRRALRTAARPHAGGDRPRPDAMSTSQHRAVAATRQPHADAAGDPRSACRSSSARSRIPAASALQLPGWTPQHDVGDVGIRLVEPDRGHHAVERVTGGVRRTAAPTCPLRSPAPRRRTSPVAAVCRARTRAGRGRAQRITLEAVEDRRTVVEVRGGLAASRAAMMAASGDGGGAAPLVPILARKSGAAVSPEAAGASCRHRHRCVGRTASGRRCDRRFADSGVHARLLIEGEEFSLAIVMLWRALDHRRGDCRMTANVEQGPTLEGFKFGTEARGLSPKRTTSARRPWNSTW